MPAAGRQACLNPETTMPDGPTSADARAAYYARIAKKHLAPLWESLHNLVPRQPAPRCVPALWKYADVRADVLESGSLNSAEEAVRSVMILENHGLPGQASITQPLNAGLQLVDRKNGG